MHIHKPPYEKLSILLY
ncbi:hypothetical protein DX932_31010 [Bacillus cereus]|uniref:Uncharacterized protein n=1 Tax=Bacillus cereus TaxID=1396 RepID=A0A9W7UNK1_BACCE|nr:hypothetical protein DX932_31010 [Bacillus cereus]KAB2500362.1 hypothetical protein F8156_20880 [Bacillus cereus]